MGRDYRSRNLLGHGTVALTLNTYSHVTAGLSDQAARLMDRMLGSELTAQHRMEAAAVGDTIFGA